MTFDQAIQTTLSLARQNVTKKEIDAFKDYQANSTWIKHMIWSASRWARAEQGGQLQQALNVLRENGIDIDVYRR